MFLITLLILGVVSASDKGNIGSTNNPLRNSTGLVVNFITGGSIGRLNHVVTFENNYNIELSRFANALDKEKCGNNSLIDIVNELLERKGVINIDLRTLLVNQTGVDKLLKPLTGEEEDLIITELKLDNNVATRESSANMADSKASLVYPTIGTYHALTQGKGSLHKESEIDDDESSRHVELLSSRGPHSESILSKRLNLSMMMSSSPELKVWEEKKSIDGSFDYYNSRLVNLVNMMSRLVTSDVYQVKNPTELCVVYTRARSTIRDSDTKNSFALARAFRKSLDCLIEIIRLSNYKGGSASGRGFEGYMADDSTDVMSMKELLEQDIQELQSMRTEINLQLQTLLYKNASYYWRLNRGKRSVSYLNNLNEGIFTGFIFKDDMDVTPELQDHLLFRKVRISDKTFSGVYWPSCTKYPLDLKSMLSPRVYHSALMVYLTSEGICFFVRFCKDNEYVDPNTNLCTPHQLAGSAHLSNVKSLSISDYIHRVGISEIDDSFKRTFDGYCSIGDIKISECQDTTASREVILLGRISGEWIIMKDDLQIGYNSDLDKITSYACTATNTSQLLNSEHPGYIKSCSKGDENYLKRFKGSEDCSCELSLQAGDLSAKYYDKLVPIDFMMQMDVMIKKPLSVGKKSICKDCELQCINGVASLTNVPRYELLSICKLGQCEYFKISDQKEDFKLHNPRMMLGEITFRLYPADTSLSKYEAKSICSLDNHCKLIDCLLCADFLMNPSCQPLLAVSLWSLLLVVPLLIINLISTTINLLLKLVKLLFSGLHGLISCCTTIWCAVGRMSKRKVNKAYQSLNEVNVEQQASDDVVTYSSRPRRFRPIIINPLNPITAMVALSLLLTAVQTCSVESIISSDSLHCSTHSDVTECTIKQDVQISLSPVGQISCLNIRKEGFNDIVGQIQIKTKTLRLVCNPSILYYSSNVKPQMTSTYRCSGAGSCDEENCKSVKDTDILTDIPNKKVFNHTGESGCRLVNGFWGNTCFYADSACKYYRVFFTSDGPTYEVFNCPTWEWMALVEITTIGSRTETRDVIVTSSEPTVVDKVSYKMISVSVKPNILYSKCFLRKTSIQYDSDPIAVTTCNVNSEAIVGKVGEIQCPTAKDADDMTIRCSYMENLFSILVNGNDLVFKTNVLDIDSIYKQNLLPMKYPGLTLETTPNHIPFISAQEASLFTLHISMTGYKVSFAESLIECGSTFINVTGCYKCDSGARVCLDSSATSYPAVFRMNCPSIIPVLKVISKKGQWCFNMPINQEKVNIDCMTTCGKEKKKIHLSGSLVYVPISKPSYVNSTTTVNEVTENFMISVWRWLSGLSLLSYFYLVISLLLGLVLTYVLLWFIFPLVIHLINKCFGKILNRRNRKEKTHNV